MSRVGERVKDARIKAGITQKALAKKLGVAEKFVNEVETGKKILNEALIEKISKVLNADLNDVNMVVTDEDLNREKEMVRKIESKKQPVKPEEVNEVWNQAFGSVMKNVPIFDYSLSKSQGYKQLPMASNKIEGHAPDKVFYIVVESDDMVGYRITKGDLAFCHIVKEPESNSICLVEHNGERVIRQIKKLDNTKALLISNKGTVRTETVNIKDINIIAKLDRLEIQL